MNDKPDSCKDCPGYKNNKGFLAPLIRPDAKIMIVGERPYSKDIEANQPMTGGYGRILKGMLIDAGISPKEVTFNYAVKCQPQTEYGTARDPSAVERETCKDKYLVGEIKNFSGNIIVPSGDIATRSVSLATGAGITGSSVDSRGYVYRGYKHKIIPIVSQQYIIEGNQEYRPVTVHDLKKVKDLQHDDKIEHTEKRYNIYPTISDIRTFGEQVLRDHRRISVDIETTGIHPEYCNIICVGIAWSESDGICIPFLKQHGNLYWENPEEEAEAWEWVYRILDNNQIEAITQNGLVFDLSVFDALGIPIRKRTKGLIDTIIKFHVMYMELPHNLNFMASLFTKKESFKSEMKVDRKEVPMITKPDKQVREYNLDDCTGTFIIDRELDKDIEDAGLTSFYNEVIEPLQYCVFKMQRHGLLLDKQEMDSLNKKAALAISSMRQSLNEALGAEFNPSSPQQVKHLFNDFLGQNIIKTDKLSLIKAIQKEPNLEPIVKTILNYRDFVKLKGTYLEMRPDPDGRVRSSYKLYGTVTWRLASSDPNFQNLPRGARHGINIKNIFVARPGYSFVGIDYSQLEARIPAYASRCTKLIKLFDNREDYYLLLANTAFQRVVTDKNSPERFNAKTFKLAQGYGGSAFTISNHILKNTYEYIEPNYIQTIIDRWAADTPEIIAWNESCYKQALAEGKVYDGFGIPCTLFVAKEDWRQIAYCRPTQTTASGIVNRATVRLQQSGIYDRYHASLCLQIHDELVHEVADDHIEDFVKEATAIMEQPITIFDYENIVFPTSVKVGKRWGTME